MEIKRFTIDASSDSLTLSVMFLEPEEAPKGIVQIIHGMSERKERYEELMRFLAGEGYATVINDIRGHGDSVRKDADLGFFYKGGYRAAIEDAAAVTSWAVNRWPDAPVILLGHSMGSLLARGYLKKHDDLISALLLLGTPVKSPAGGIARLLALISGLARGWHYRSKFINSLIFGKFNSRFASEGASNAWLSTDRSEVELYRNDPRNGFVFTANGFYNLLGLMRFCYSAYGWKHSNWSLPVRFLSGADDPCMKNERELDKAVSSLRKAGYPNVSSRIFEGMRHEIHKEVGRRAVFNDILEFMEKSTE